MAVRRPGGMAVCRPLAVCFDSKTTFGEEAGRNGGEEAGRNGGEEAGRNGDEEAGRNGGV